MTATPIWFGPPHRPLFGWLHAPDDGTVRAGVVLCAPLGYDAIVTHRTFRVLAERLAEAGFAALRFDYDGTGDSAGDHRDQARVAAWLDSTRRAARLLRSGGADRIAVVGMRLGATVGSAALAGDDPDAVVLWDPSWSGRAALRQLRALQLIGIGDTGPDPDLPGSLSVAGAIYTAETLGELRALKLPALDELPCPVLVLTRPDQAPPKELASPPSNVSVGEATAQAELIDRVSAAARVPGVAIDTIVSWLDEHVVGEPAPFTVPAREGAATVAAGVTERIEMLGPLELFAVVTEATAGAERHLPVIVLLNNAADHHIGPNRFWVDWARELSLLGFAVARVDLSAIGDSPARPGQRLDATYPPEAGDDLAAIVTALDRGAGVVLGGLCSGAYNALQVPPAVAVRGVFTINVITHLRPSLLHTISNEEPEPPGVLASYKHWRVRGRALRKVPAPAWRALDATGLVRHRARSLQALVDRGTDVLALYGEDDYFLQRLEETSAWAIDRLSRRAGFRFVEVPDLDHSAMSPAPRREAARVITDHLVQRYDRGRDATKWNHRTSSTEAPAPSGTEASLP